MVTTRSSRTQRPVLNDVSNSVMDRVTAAVGKPTKEKPPKGKPPKEQSSKGQPTKGKPTTGQPTKGPPTKGKPTTGQPTNKALPPFVATFLKINMAQLEFDLAERLAENETFMIHCKASYPNLAEEIHQKDKDDSDQRDMDYFKAEEAKLKKFVEDFVTDLNDAKMRKELRLYDAMKDGMIRMTRKDKRKLTAQRRARKALASKKKPKVVAVPGYPETDRYPLFPRVWQSKEKRYCPHCVYNYENGGIGCCYTHLKKMTEANRLDRYTA